MHVSRRTHTCEESCDPEAIDYVIDVKAISRARAVAIPRKCAIQAVTQPVDGEEETSEEKPIRAVAGKCVRRSGEEHAYCSKSGEVVGVDSLGSSCRQPNQN